MREAFWDMNIKREKSYYNNTTTSEFLLWPWRAHLKRKPEGRHCEPRQLWPPAATQGV